MIRDMVYAGAIAFCLVKPQVKTYIINAYDTHIGKGVWAAFQCDLVKAETDNLRGASLKLNRLAYLDKRLDAWFLSALRFSAQKP